MEQSTDLTELAREGKLDPTIGRDEGCFFVFLAVVKVYSKSVPIFQKYAAPFKVSFFLQQGYSEGFIFL